MRRRQFVVATLAWTAWPGRAESAYDHTQRAWTALLAKHVVVLRGGQASLIRYAALAAERDALRRVLAGYSAVTRAAFDHFTVAQRMAFLINAYNAFTIELILGKYPALQSIKDLGTLFESPWKRKWIPLFGSRVSLDDIEHGLLRKRGAYDDARLHFAVNCASIGCPMLRAEAYVATRLDGQLDEQAERFMSDRSRNRWNTQRDRLELSRIFDWYGDDFQPVTRGGLSLKGFIARHAERLADGASERAHLRSGRFDISFLDYDWALNDAGAEP